MLDPLPQLLKDKKKLEKYLSMHTGGGEGVGVDYGKDTCTLEICGGIEKLYKLHCPTFHSYANYSSPLHKYIYLK